jgi:hypothetical protein
MVDNSVTSMAAQLDGTWESRLAAETAMYLAAETVKTRVAPMAEKLAGWSARSTAVRSVAQKAAQMVEN